MWRWSRQIAVGFGWITCRIGEHISDDCLGVSYIKVTQQRRPLAIALVHRTSPYSDRHMMMVRWVCASATRSTDGNGDEVVVDGWDGSGWWWWSRAHVYKDHPTRLERHHSIRTLSAIRTSRRTTLETQRGQTTNDTDLHHPRYWNTSWISFVTVFIVEWIINMNKFCVVSVLHEGSAWFYGADDFVFKVQEILVLRLNEMRLFTVVFFNLSSNPFSSHIFKNNCW